MVHLMSTLLKMVYLYYCKVLTMKYPYKKLALNSDSMVDIFTTLEIFHPRSNLLFLSYNEIVS